MNDALTEETVALADLKPHSRNYRKHPADQIEHLKASIEKHGMYRNVVIARDGTILAGHGVVEAAKALGLDSVPARRLDIDPDDIRALEVLTGDNEVDHLGEVDDRALTELLKEIRDVDLDGLLGTGYDDMMLANLAFVTRPASEIADKDQASEWVGMPDYEPEGRALQVIVSFRDVSQREKFAQVLDIPLTEASNEARRVLTAWYPPEGRDDRSSVRFVEG